MEMILPDSPPRGGVLVVHAWWGLTPGVRAQAEALRGAGFAVALADLYQGRLARDAAEARALRAQPRRVPMYRDLAAGIAQLGAARVGPLAVVGYSMGGHWAVWLAQRPEYDLRAAVLYYAARGGDFTRSRARFLAHFAGVDDPFVTPSARRGMERAIAKAGLHLETHDYPGTSHGFIETGQTAHDPAADAQAMARSIAFLNAALATPR